MINLKNDHREIRRGDIFWHLFDNTIMPVLVVQNDKGNQYSTNTIVVKMSSSKAVAEKSVRIPTIIEIPSSDIMFKNGCKLDDVGYVLASDIKTIPKDSLQHFIGVLKEDAFESVNKALKISLGI